MTDDLRQCADDLARLIDETKSRCELNGIPPHRALATDGSPLLAPLVAAQAHVLVALAARDA